MKLLEGQYICPICKKTFTRLCEAKVWAYRYKVKGNIKCACSWSCQLKAEKTIPEEEERL